MMASQAAASPCTDLSGTVLVLGSTASTVSLAAADVIGGSFTAPNGVVFGGLPDFCRVSMVLSSSGNAQTSALAVEVWLPETQWNYRLLGLGNSGFGGSIAYSLLQQGLKQGFVVTNTDLGTGILFGCNAATCGNHTGQGGTPGGLYGDAPAIRDFGYAATHLMTLAARQIITAYYGKAAKYAYFDGCSTGGQQAMMESQRFPNDYDGILAGAPAYDRTHLHMAGAGLFEVAHQATDSVLTSAALSLAHALVLGQCAGTDGGLRTDDFLTQPAMCAASANALVCTGAAGDVPCTAPAAASCTCLTQDQASTLAQSWSGVTDDTGAQLYPGKERGWEEAGVTVNTNAGGPQQPAGEPPFDSLMFWAMGPDWAWQDLFANVSAPLPELSAEIAAIDNTSVSGISFANVLNATSTDLSAFNAAGHKLIIYQGYADQIIPSASSIDYYNKVAATDPAVGGYLRLFMAPGVWHCGNGPGANAFGPLSLLPPPQPGNPADDLLAALRVWVESGAAPQQVVATKYINDSPAAGIAFRRQLCPYPAHSAYAGGLRNNPSGYTCVPGRPVTNQGFSPGYGP